MSICHCGKNIPNKKAKQCRDCWKKSVRHLCKTCSIKIKKNKHGYCRPCFHKYQTRERTCKNCENTIAPRGRSKIFCASCYRKIEWEEKKEEKNKYHRNYKRKKKGIRLDLPNMRDGSMGNLDTQTGYRSVVAHGHTNVKNKKGRIYEHVLVMSQVLGRALRKGESVHHLNGIRDDNRPENLELWDKSQPAGQRVKDKISFYKEFLEFHGYTISKNND